MVIVVVVYLIYGHTKTNIFCGLVIFKRMTFHEWHSLIKIGLAYMAMFEKSYSNVQIFTKTAQIKYFWTLGMVLPIHYISKYTNYVR